MATIVTTQRYELISGPAEDRLEFRARGIVRALIRAASMIGPGCSATLLEDGSRIGMLTPDGRLTIEEHSASQRDLAGKGRSGHADICER